MPRLQVEGDVALNVDGVPATLSGRDNALVIKTDSPKRLLDGAGPALDRIDAVAASLAQAGLRLVVEGPHGPVATMGAEVHSTMGRLLAGSPRVRLGRPAAVWPVARGRISRRLHSRSGLAAAAVIAVVIAYGARRAGADRRA